MTYYAKQSHFSAKNTKNWDFYLHFIKKKRNFAA